MGGLFLVRFFGRRFFCVSVGVAGRGLVFSFWFGEVYRFWLFMEEFGLFFWSRKLDRGGGFELRVSWMRFLLGVFWYLGYFF